MAIRPFRESDLAELTALHRTAFGPGQPGSDTGARLRSAFVESPWQDAEIPSLVWEEGNQVVGFLGATTRPMFVGSTPVRVVLPSVLMVRPDWRRKGIARGLLSRLMAGPQRLTFTMHANAASQSILTAMGWYQAAFANLWWCRPLRPLRYGLGEVAEAPGNARARRVLAAAVKTAVLGYGPIDWILAKRLARHVQRSLGGLQRSHLNAVDVANNFSTTCSSRQLCPTYTENTLNWLLGRVEARQQRRHERILVRDERGNLVGWYIYSLAKTGVASVVQMVAAPGRHDVLVMDLLHHAYEHEATAVRVRFDRSFGATMGSHCSWFERQGAPLLLHSRDPELVKTVLGADMCAGPLEGDVGF